MGHRRNFQMAVHDSIAGPDISCPSIHLDTGSFTRLACRDLAVVMANMALAPEITVDQTCDSIDTVFDRCSRERMPGNRDEFNPQRLENLVMSTTPLIVNISEGISRVEKPIPDWLEHITGKLGSVLTASNIILAPLRKTKESELARVAEEKAVWDKLTEEEKEALMLARTRRAVQLSREANERAMHAATI